MKLTFLNPSVSNSFSKISVPSASPRNLRGSSKTLEMNIQWDAIPSSDWQGVPRGYNVYYRVMTKDKGWQSIETDVKSYTFKGKACNTSSMSLKSAEKQRLGLESVARP